MKKQFTRWSLLLLSVIMLVGYVIPMWSLTIPVKAYDATEDKQKVKLMEDELAALRDSSSIASEAYKEALAAYKETEADIAAAEKLKISLDKEILALETEIDKTQQLLTTYNEQLAYYADAVVEKQAEIDDRYALFIDRVRINYEDSFTSYLEIVLSSASFSDLLALISSQVCLSTINVCLPRLIAPKKSFRRCRAITRCCSTMRRKRWISSQRKCRSWSRSGLTTNSSF